MTTCHNPTVSSAKTIKRDFAVIIIAYQSLDRISNVELAKRLKVSPARVAQMRSGKENFCIDSMVKIGKALGFDIVLRDKDRNKSVNK